MSTLGSIFCIWMIIGVGTTITWADISYDSINITIINDDANALQTQVLHSLESAKNFFDGKIAEVGASAAGVALSLVPYVGFALRAAVPAVHNTLKSNSDEMLSKIISDVADHRIAKEKIGDMQASLNIITEKLQWMNDNLTSFSSNQKETYISIINNELDKIVKMFDRRDGVLRKYPRLGVPTLFALAELITVFNFMEKIIHPNQAERSLLSCNFYYTLLDYRYLIAGDHLNRLEIDVEHNIGFGINLGDTHRSVAYFAANVMSRPYNQNGYAQTNTRVIKCNKIRIELGVRHFYLRDVFSGNSYPADAMRYVGAAQALEEKFVDPNCVIGYMELARHRIERAFDTPLYLANNVCSEQKRSFLKPTGSGWLILTIVSATWVSHKDCDRTGACDLYVKLYVNDKKVLKTQIVVNQDTAYFYETYRSELIPKTTRIQIDLWDADNGLNLRNDFIHSFSITDKDLVQDGYKKFSLSNNKEITTHIIWKDEVNPSAN